MKILVPDTIPLELDTSRDELVHYDVTAPIPPAARDADVLVVWRNADENLRDAAALPGLRLVQTLAAGPDQILAAGFGPETVLASGRSLHDGPVAEHALALVLAAVRRLDLLGTAQRDSRWDSDFLDAQRAPETEALYTLSGSRVTIWGFGSIAARLAPMLAALGASVTGVAGSAGIRSGFPVVAAAELPALLEQTDVLISLLPASPETDKALGADLLERLPRHAVFVNVGRGATVDEEALVAALRAGRLRVAALDVTRAEPLPVDSELWSAPNLLLTPHAAGNRPQNATALVQESIDAAREGRTVRNALERTRV
ncbi:NAD(P)-dependent oxidoreductase [Rathayibacter sp. SD072]|uniref:NAD(P)-dependent oxidoreductase n=1 Tax=Rathayibacter sp. SD072 TaxID=2781731 RepID=UPI001A95F81E|nr:NAD(P)-dependent oxidoreductase [Rathayibacter sp. SD072]MBO0982640.1 phosphoglycerate dehydrogenase [Rathayibacter sp. SD072]